MTGTLRRRLLPLLTPLVLAAVVAGATYLAYRSSAGERVAQIWASATIAADGSARIHEVIDYDFGGSDRHGIFRDIPDVDLAAPLEVSSPDAPDEFTVTGSGTVHVRIGDPARTVTGLHRYELDYTLESTGPDGELAWDAVGSGWDVPIDHLAVQVAAATELSEIRCLRGGVGGADPCDVDQTEPGHLVATADHLAAHKRVTVYAVDGSLLAQTPALPGTPDPVGGLGASGLAALAAAATLLAALATAGLIRRAGRDHAPAGVPWLAAPGQRIDRARLASAAQPSPTLPHAVTAPEGGVLLEMRVLDRHKAAWLLERAVAGEIALEQGGSTRYPAVDLVRLQPGSGTTRGLLDRAFQGRERLALGQPDREFARSWRELGHTLATWRRTGGMWDPAGGRRAVRTRILGILLGLAGLVVAVLGAVQFAGRAGSGLVVAVVGAVLAGAGLLAAVRADRLRALTAQGSDAWLQVESLRQFLARSESGEVGSIPAEHLDAYTPWAVALGEADRWSRLAPAAARAATSPATGLSTYDANFALYGPAFTASCATTGNGLLVDSGSASGSSDYGGSFDSGGGGGGDFGGGGDGGGGGGSW